MDKEEELKQKARIPKRWAFDFIPTYIFTEEELQQYVDEVSREVLKQAFKAGMVFQEFDTAKDFDDWWDWLKEQEEQQ